jgi:hypothetical protein
VACSASQLVMIENCQKLPKIIEKSPKIIEKLLKNCQKLAKIPDFPSFSWCTVRQQPYP